MGTEAITGKHIMGAYPFNSTLEQAVAVYTNLNCKANTSPIGVHFIFLVLWFGISWEAVSTTCHRYIVLLKIPAVDLDAVMDTNSGVVLNSAPDKGNHDITTISSTMMIYFGCGHMHKYMGVDEENKDTPVAVNYRIVKSSGTQ